MDPYKTIWFAPKRTFEKFFQEDSKEQPVFFFPFLIMGLSFAITMTSDTGNLLGDGNPIWTALIMIPFGIGITYLFMGLIMPSMTKLTGRIWNGNSNLRQMTNVYAISTIPYGIFLIYQVALFAAGSEPTLDNINGGVDYILRLWTFALLTIGIAKIQRFSYGFALLNIILAYLPLLIIVLLIRS